MVRVSLRGNRPVHSNQPCNKKRKQSSFQVGSNGQFDRWSRRGGSSRTDWDQREDCLDLSFFHELEIIEHLNDPDERQVKKEQENSNY
jgi:hypothetical protein